MKTITSNMVEQSVADYFKENEITDLMSFGETGNEGLRDISEPFAAVFTKLGFAVKSHHAEEGDGDGKYWIYLEIPELDDKNIKFLTKAWHGATVTAGYICGLLDYLQECFDSLTFIWKIKV